MGPLCRNQQHSPVFRSVNKANSNSVFYKNKFCSQTPIIKNKDRLHKRRLELISNNYVLHKYWPVLLFLMIIFIISPADLEFPYGHGPLERTNNKRSKICRCLRDSNLGPFAEQDEAGSRGSSPPSVVPLTDNKIVCLNMIKIKAQLIRHKV